MGGVELDDVADADADAGADAEIVDKACFRHRVRGRERGC